MAIPSSGAISFLDIQTEFGGSNPISLNEYYAGGPYVGSGTSGTNGAVPSSGQIGISNFYGTTAAVIGQAAYTTAGTYTWVAPAGVTKVSVVAIGGGGGGRSSGGGGGGLAYLNNYTVTAGASYTVVVGGGGSGSYTYYNCPWAGSITVSSNRGGDSSFNGTFPKALGGGINCDSPIGKGGTQSGTYTGGGTGGKGGSGGSEGGGGGAAGYSGTGGYGGWPTYSYPLGRYDYRGGDGAGGGGGGGSHGANNVRGGGGGGGVGILGQGPNGAGAYDGPSGCITANYGGKGGGGGSSGAIGSDGIRTGFSGPPYYCEGNNTQEYPFYPAAGGGGGGLYGGGGGGASQFGGAGARGAVRIIYPGNTRSFPSTCTGNL